MAKRIVVALIVIVLAVGIYYWWTNRTDADTIGSGGVSSHDTLGKGSKASMDQGIVSGSDIDGKPNDSYGGDISYDNKPAAPKPTPTPAAAVASTGTTTVNGGSASPQAVTQAPATMPGPTTVMPTTVAGGASSMPVSDTLSPNAPNGMAFGGNGKFQWYRQGNLTWRINTQSGDTCIAFATMDEWQKPIVYTHGCGGNA